MLSQKTIVLKSSDGETFDVVEAVALQSQAIKHMIEDDCTGSGIPLPNVTGKILALVIDYCKNHMDPSTTDDNKDLKSFDSEFVRVDQDTLFDLLLAANYLDVKGLLDLACKTVGEMITSANTVEKTRKKFNIKNDYTPEEEAAARQEYAWAFEP